MREICSLLLVLSLLCPSAAVASSQQLLCPTHGHATPISCEDPHPEHTGCRGHAVTVPGHCDHDSDARLQASDSCDPCSCPATPADQDPASPTLTVDEDDADLTETWTLAPWFVTGFTLLVAATPSCIHAAQSVASQLADLTHPRYLTLLTLLI